jgi:hypothetical protein
MTIVQTRPVTLTTRCHFIFTVRPVERDDDCIIASAMLATGGTR